MRLLARHYPSIKPPSAAAPEPLQPGVQLVGQRASQAIAAGGAALLPQQPVVAQPTNTSGYEEDGGELGEDGGHCTTGGSTPVAHAILMMPVRSTMMGAFPLSFTYFQVSTFWEHKPYSCLTAAFWQG
jgi:hypothetical protein